MFTLNLIICVVLQSKSLFFWIFFVYCTNEIVEEKYNFFKTFVKSFVPSTNN